MKINTSEDLQINVGIVEDIELNNISSDTELDFSFDNVLPLNVTIEENENIDAAVGECLNLGGGGDIDKVPADKVYFKEDIIAAGNYTQIGNITKGIDEVKVLPFKNKTLEYVTKQIFTKEIQPTKTNPRIDISLSQSGKHEVGTSITPSYNVVLNKGSYTFDNNTGVSFNNCNVSDSNGNSSTSLSGKFPSIVVKDNTNYYISATSAHSAGIVAHTNLGNISNPPVQITAGSKLGISDSISGYRAFFYGIDLTTNTLDSDIIRALTNGNEYDEQKTFTISVGGAAAKRIIIAIPASSSRMGLLKVEKKDGMVIDITSAYRLQTDYVEVDDCELTGNNKVPYKIWLYQPAKIDAAEIHEITLG